MLAEFTARSLLVLALSTGTVCQAQEVSKPASELAAIEKAWSYLAKSSDARWIVIESKTNGRYVQCARVEEYALCEVPIWTKRAPGSPDLTPVLETSPDAPPEIEGAEL